MSYQESKKDFITDWAFKDDFTTHVHITNAKSGLNGYYCLGCKKEMQAVKGLVREHYFRHHAKDVDKNNAECVVANRKYRELIARDILQRLKKLKLPAVYKYPPKNIDGLPNLLQRPKVITAFKVKSELTFYEDDNCNIKYGQNPNVNDRYLLVRPDISFFNEKQEPILLVEFVVTHKINDDKRTKLKRLGINTVQIIIPKKSEEEIEKTLKSSAKIKWVYNEVEAKAKYIYVSESSNNGVWEIDDEQRRIFEESYKCRTSQIKNLIRSVRRILESQPYKRAEQHFEQEISRIERATGAEEQGLVDMETRIENEVREELAGRFQAIESEENSFVSEENRFRQKAKGLETRYFDKRRSIDKEQSELSKDFEQQGVFGVSEEEIRSDFESRRGKIRKEQEAIDSKTTAVERNIRQSPTDLEQYKEREYQSYRAEIEKLESEQRSVESKIENFGEYAEEEERKLEQEFKEFRKQTIKRINKRVSKGDSELSKRIKTILNVGRIATNYNERLETYERYRTYLELARKRAWEK